MRTRTVPSSRQAGFSMVEMLMAAFILAIGILGLTMLQTMSMRASRGSRSLSTAVQVAEAMLDQVEMEGRLTWLNATTTIFAAPPAPPPLVYFNPMRPVVRTFTINGRPPDPAATDPADINPFFTATLGAPVFVSSGVNGQSVHDFTVTVTFNDTVQAGSTAVVQRSVVLTRRIVHA